MPDRVIGARRLSPEMRHHHVWQAEAGDTATARYRIGEAARRLKVSPSVLRLWERQGLVRPARTEAGYRLYSSSDLELLGRVRQMRAVHKVNAPGIRRILERPGTIRRDSELRGARLRALRQRAGLSLRQASERSGLSAGFISAIERGVSGASVATLQNLTSACEGTLQELFDEAPTGRLVRPDQRPVLQLGDGAVRIEQLAVSASQLEPHLFTLAPGASSQGSYAHEGEEFIFVLEGQVHVRLGDAELYQLNTGDALTFSSPVPHGWENRGDQEARLLWINTPPTF
jgi:DNA-binding transcriptional MerR regulator/quercetin dioxygenase-like cupin family protein